MAPNPDKPIDLQTIESEAIARALEVETERARRAALLEYERGRREALADAHTAEQDRHLNFINGSIERTATEIAGVRREVADVKGQVSVVQLQFEKFAAVTQAMSDRSVSTRTFGLGVVAVVAPIVALLLTTAH